VRIAPAHTGLQLVTIPAVKVAGLLPCAADLALNIEPPDAGARLESQRLEGNLKFGSPAVGDRLLPNHPDTVPIGVRPAALGYASVHERTQWIGLNIVSIPAIVEGVDQNLDIVFVGQCPVTSHLGGEDSLGFAVS